MDQTEHIIPNALLSVPDANAVLMQKCRVFPVEFVVRGFLTGSLPLPLLVTSALLSDFSERDHIAGSSYSHIHEEFQLCCQIYC